MSTSVAYSEGFWMLNSKMQIYSEKQFDLHVYWSFLLKFPTSKSIINKLHLLFVPISYYELLQNSTLQQQLLLLFVIIGKKWNSIVGVQGKLVNSSYWQIKSKVCHMSNKSVSCVSSAVRCVHTCVHLSVLGKMMKTFFGKKNCSQFLILWWFVPKIFAQIFTKLWMQASYERCAGLPF